MVPPNWQVWQSGRNFLLIFTLYNIVISIYIFGAYLVGFFSEKANKLIHRKDSGIDDLNNWKSKNNITKLVWFHCASLGEYEEARTYRDYLCENYERLGFVFSFFSPSGYENANLQSLDKKFYLPWDFLGNQEKLVELLDPQLVVFIKYEYWFNLLSVLKKRSIPYGYLNARLSGREYFNKFKPFSDLLKSAKFIAVTNEVNLSSLKNIGFKNLLLTKDPRWNAAIRNKQTEYKTKFDFPLTEKQVFILGSIHKSDFPILKILLQDKQKYFLVIAPHEISLAAEILGIAGSGFHFYSALPNKNIDGIIIDTIGDLKYLYRYASLSYIGGGKKEGIHNVFESLIFNIPTFYFPFSGESLPETKNLIAINDLRELQINIKEIEGNQLNNKTKTSTQYDSSIINLCTPELKTIFDQILI